MRNKEEFFERIRTYESTGEFDKKVENIGERRKAQTRDEARKAQYWEAAIKKNKDIGKIKNPEMEKDYSTLLDVNRSISRD